MTKSDSSLRREIAIVLVLTAIGAVLRLWSFWGLGLQHFDEGVYALSGLWILSPHFLAGIDPTVISYAPPGFPILVGLAYLLFGVADLSAIAVSVLCGLITIPVAGWLGRRTFGPGAGAAAAAFAAVSGEHVALSRMSLTDVPFLLFWLASIGVGARFLEKPGFGRALIFGVLVGLAQNFKYNGWLAGVVVGMVVLIDCIAKRRDASKEIVYGLVAAIVSTIVYTPWFLFVDRHGGYASLLAHHRGYMGGLAEWWPHWKAQMAQSVALAGSLSWGKSGFLSWGVAAWALAWLACAFARKGRRLVDPGTEGRWTRFSLCLLAGTVAFGALPNLPWWVGLAMAPWLMRDGRPALRVVSSWWLVLSVLTPFYHPYARLWLPIQAVGWIVMAGLNVELVCAGAAPALARADEFQVVPRSGHGVERGVTIALAGLALVLLQELAVPLGAKPLPGLLLRSDSLKRAVLSSIPLVRADARPLRTLARPPVGFYLTTLGNLPFQPQADVPQIVSTTRSGELVLLDDVLIQQSLGSAENRLLELEKWNRLGRWPTEMNLPTWLDVDPGAASSEHSRPVVYLRLLQKPR